MTYRIELYNQRDNLQLVDECRSLYLAHFQCKAWSKEAAGNYALLIDLDAANANDDYEPEYYGPDKQEAS